MAHHKDPDHALRKAISTERFELVPLNRLAAFRLSYPWNADPELMRNLFHSSKPMRRWKWYKRVVKGIGKRKFAHAIVPRGESKPIGMHMVSFQSGYRSAGFFVALHDRSWWGKKVVEEIRREVVDTIFRSGLADRICCQVSARNMPSVFNYRKLGFRHVGTFHKSQKDAGSGELSDVVFFELLREHWTPATEAGAHG